MPIRFRRRMPKPESREVSAHCRFRLDPELCQQPRAGSQGEKYRLNHTEWHPTPCIRQTHRLRDSTSLVATSSRVSPHSQISVHISNGTGWTVQSEVVESAPVSTFALDMRMIRSMPRPLNRRRSLAASGMALEDSRRATKIENLARTENKSQRFRNSQGDRHLEPEPPPRLRPSQQDALSRHGERRRGESVGLSVIATVAGNGNSSLRGPVASRGPASQNLGLFGPESDCPSARTAASTSSRQEGIAGTGSKNCS